MNTPLRATRRMLSQAGQHGLRLGLAALLAFSVGVISVAWAQPSGPETNTGIQGVVVHACPDGDAYDAPASAGTGDPAGDDDLLARAGMITAGTSQQRNFDGNLNTGIEDRDWVRFEVEPKSVYTLTTSSLSDLTDTVLKLYDMNGSPVLSGTVPVENDDSGAADFGSRIVWSSGNASGPYYVLVENKTRSTSAYDDCVSTEVRYTLTLESQLSTGATLYLPLIMR